MEEELEAENSCSKHVNSEMVMYLLYYEIGCPICPSLPELWLQMRRHSDHN